MAFAHRLTGLAIMLSLVAWVASPAAAADIVPGFNPDRHMALDEVEPGMRGYGMSVFSGTEPEPFAVEIVTVASSMPGKSVIWIHCPGERMQKSGPVSGMSGSPIYLWAKDAKDPQLGKGGRMIGAFAYGFSMPKDCFAGVQPIEQMLDAATRQRDPEQVTASVGDARDRLLSIALAQANQQNLPDHQTWRLRTLAQILDIDPAPLGDAATPAAPFTVRQALPVPVTVADATHTAWLNPYLQPAGMAAVPVAGGATAPPRWIDADRVRFQPGGMMAVPMISGDMDLAASGTVTDILDNGQLLAFGHAFFGEGPVNVPIATCFVHFIVPNLTMSFKMSGSLDVRGALVHDEGAAVIGVEDHRAPTATAHVEVHRPNDGADDQFNYQIVQHPYLSPVMAAYTAAYSMIAESQPPLEHTLTIRTTMRFEDGRELKFDDVMPQGGAMGAMFQIIPTLASTTANPFHRVTLEDMDVDITIREQVDLATLTDVTARQREIEAGKTLTAHVTVQPHRRDPVEHRVDLKIPRDLPPGQYTIMLGGAAIHAQQVLKARPHLTRVRDVDDLFEVLQWMADMRSDALYATAAVQQRASVAVGRTELPRLPSSRMAMLNSSTSTRATPYVELLGAVYDMPYVIEGQAALQITVLEPKPLP